MESQRVYESTFIVTPDLAQQDYSTIVEKFNKILTDNGATIASQEIWGLRKLAYEIRRKQSGFYVYTEFHTANTDLLQKLETEYSYDERILRSLTVVLEKFALEWNNKRKSRLKNKAVEPA